MARPRATVADFMAIGPEVVQQIDPCLYSAHLRPAQLAVDINFYTHVRAVDCNAGRTGHSGVAFMWTFLIKGECTCIGPKEHVQVDWMLLNGLITNLHTSTVVK